VPSAEPEDGNDTDGGAKGGSEIGGGGGGGSESACRICLQVQERKSDRTRSRRAFSFFV